MKLLVFSHPCATAVNQQLYAEVKRQTGWDVTLVVPSNWLDEYGRVCQVERWPTFDGELVTIPVVKPGNIILHAYKARLSKLIRRVRPDVIYVHHEPYGVATAQVAWAARAITPRPVLGFYSAQNILKKYPPPFRWAESAVLRSAGFALPCSRDVEKTLRTKGYAAASTVLPLAIDPAVYHPDPAAAETRRQWTAGDDGTLLMGYVGRLVPEKGLATLMKALPLLADLNWKLVLIGVGPQEAELKAAAAAAGLAGRVVFHGFVPHVQVPKLLSALDVMVLPSETQPNWREQFGRVVLEAMACGTPVVGSDSGEIPVLIHETGGGLTFRERDPADLAAALRRVLTDAELRGRLAQAGEAAVAARFTVADVARHFAETVETACRSTATGAKATHTATPAMAGQS